MGDHRATPQTRIRVVITRRRALAALGAAAGASLASGIALFDAVPAAAATLDDAPRAFPVTHVNHISLVVADYARSRDFFAGLFGLRVVWDDGKMCALEFGDPQAPNGLYLRGPNSSTEKPGVNHIAFAMRDFMAHKAEIKREIDRRGFKNVRPDGAVGWSFDDPAGFPLNVVVVKDAAMFPGAASPCQDAGAQTCADARAAGVKHLDAAPPARGGLRASAFSHIVLNVPDVATEMAFYRDMLGMTVLQSPEANGACALRFGQNTLYLRPMASPGPKGFVDHFAFVIDGWNSQRVKTELERHGLKPVANTKFAWTIVSPDGLPIDAAASGLPPRPTGRCGAAAAAVDANLCASER